MFEIKIHPFNLIHIEYNHQSSDIPVIIECDFKDQIFFDEKYSNPAILFRLTTRVHSQDTTVLSYIGEQSFRFVPNAKGIVIKNVDLILRKFYEHYETAFYKEAIHPFARLPILDYPSQKDIHLMCEALKS